MSEIIGYQQADGLNAQAVSDAYPLPTKVAGGSAANPNGNPATIYTDQQAVTATATALTAQAMVNGFVLTASPLNTISVLVGGATVTAANDGAGTGYPLAPGQSISFGVTNTSAVYVIASTTGAFVSVAGN